MGGIMHSSRLVMAASAALAAIVQLTRTGRAFAQVFVRGLLAILVGVIVCCAANAVLAEEPLKLADSQLEPAKWADLVGWKADDHLAAFAAYDTSCQALRKKQGADGGRSRGHCGTPAARPWAHGRRIPIPLAPFSNRIFNRCASRVWVKHRVS
jgi:hypothetical protein